MLPDTLHKLPRDERFAYARLLAYMARVDNEITVDELAMFEQRIGTALYLGLCVELGGSGDARVGNSRLHYLFRCAEPRVDDRGHPPLARRKSDLETQ